MKPAGAPCVCLCTPARVCECMCVCAHKRNPFLSTMPSSFLSTLSPGGPWDPSAWKQNPPPQGLPSVTCACICALVRRGWGGARASLFRASAKETVEKYHHKSVLEGEAAVVLFRWLIYGRRGLHIKTVCQTSWVDTN